MKTFKTIAMTMLMSTMAATTFTSCKDDVVEDMKSNPMKDSFISASTNLQSLDNISYTVPYQVKAKGDWRIDFEFENGQQICYAYPKQGHGDTTVKICVLDNATEQHRTGEMTVTDFGDNAKKTVVKLGQKSKLEGTRADNVITGNRIYGVGYGYNAVTNEVANNQIVMVSEALENKKIVTNGVNATYEIRNYKGSCFSQLANDLKAEAKFNGKYFGFRAAAGASFEAKAFQETNHDYVINMIDVTTTRAHLEMGTQEIIANHMTDAAYDAINGLAPKSTKGRTMVTVYPTSNEGFKKLIKDYGTHLLVRAELGGKMKYASTIDLSKVENEYTLNAYARCSYKNCFIKAKAGVSDDLSKKFQSNSEAIKTTLKIQGGSQADITSLQAEDNDANMTAWLKSLENNQNTVVVNLPNAEMIPLWELVNTGLKDGATRKEKLRQYMEGGQMKRDFADDGTNEMKNMMGKMAHIKGLDKMIPYSEEGTLIKDVYIGSTCVARVCSEFIPKFSTSEPSIIIYPVSDNWTKYNMGLFIGNKAWKPQYICWKNEGAPIVTPVENSKPGMMTELYLSGSSFYAPDDEVVKEAKEEKTEAIIKDAFMQGRTMWRDGSEHPHDYPIVKIFNRIWQRTPYNQLVEKDVVYYQPSNVPFFTLNNWSIAKVDDYKNLMNGLTSNNISLPGLYMSEVEGGKDLTGFSIQWDGWRVKVNGSWTAKEKGGSQMEYMTCDKDGKYGHVRLKKAGSMEIVENEFNTFDWRMEVRMVQPLSPVKKTQAK